MYYMIFLWLRPSCVLQIRPLKLVSTTIIYRLKFHVALYNLYHQYSVNPVETSHRECDLVRKKKKKTIFFFLKVGKMSWRLTMLRPTILVQCATLFYL